MKNCIAEAICYVDKDNDSVTLTILHDKGWTGHKVALANIVFYEEKTTLGIDAQTTIELSKHLTMVLLSFLSR